MTTQQRLKSAKKNKTMFAVEHHAGKVHIRLDTPGDWYIQAIDRKDRIVLANDKEKKVCSYPYDDVYLVFPLS